MNRVLPIIAAVSFLFALIFGLVPYWKLRTAALEVDDSAQELRDGATSVESALALRNRLSAANDELAHTVNELIAGPPNNRGEKGALETINAQSRKLMQVNSDVIAAIADLQKRNEEKLRELEAALTAMGAMKAGFSTESILSLLGIVTGVSTLLLGWRKDYRETLELKIELAKLQAASK